MNRLNKRYTEEVVPSLMQKIQLQISYGSSCCRKIVINMGIGEAIANPKLLDEAVAELAQITGQQPVITRAKKINCKLQIT